MSRILQPHTIEVEKLSEWMANETVLYARSSHDEKSLSCTLNGTFIVTAKGKVVLKTIYPTQAVNMYNSICYGEIMQQDILPEIQNPATSVNPFVAQTANDYNIPYDIALHYYNKYGSTASYYDALEKHINTDHESE